MKTMTQITVHTRFVITENVRTTLRVIQRRCSTYERRRPAPKPVTVTVSHTMARTTLLAPITGPNGLTAPIVSPIRPAGSTPPKT